MKSFSYTKSHTLLERIQKLDELRSTLLLQLLSPTIELQFQWEATKERYRYTLLPYGIAVSEKAIENIFTVNKETADSQTKTILKRYKKVHDYIFQNWYINKAHLTTNDIEDLLKLAQYKGRFDSTSLSRYLQYIQINPEHPVIQAALMYIMFLSLVTVNEEAKSIAAQLSTLFLAKYGYDIHRLVVLEKAFVKSTEKLNEHLIKFSRSQNATDWIEYFIEQYTALLQQIQTEFDHVEEKKTSSTFAHLTQRQKEIIGMLERPESRITNKVVQKTFGISQITASRDLTKLADLGLLFVGGQGRSVYYTRV